MTPEFELIAKYFSRPPKHASLGVGDDCALILASPGYELAISTDTLVSGAHFFADTDAFKLGYKALAVNLSDLAAMGATPRYVTLALTLPTIDHDWLDGFCRGFFTLAEETGTELIGGDTTRGPLAITLTVLGEIKIGAALRRDRAEAGDDIWVSGSLGAAALALKHLQGLVVVAPNDLDTVLGRLHTPMPRIELGCALLNVAHAAIDISDGLVADLQHICEKSRLSAVVEWASVPLAPALLSVASEMQMTCALAGGDDYELCFTAPEQSRASVGLIAQSIGLPLSRIGRMQSGNVGVTVLDAGGDVIDVGRTGFDHFSTTSG